jgi:hypothetical protein
MLGEVGIQCEVSFPESGAASALSQSGWDGLLIAQARSMASITTTYRRFMDPNYTYYVSLWRPSDDEYRELYVKSRSTPTMEDGMMRELSRIMMDNMLIIPIYDTYETNIIRNDVHDSGLAEWGSGTLWRPDIVWKSSN